MGWSLHGLNLYNVNSIIVLLLICFRARHTFGDFLNTLRAAVPETDIMLFSWWVCGTSSRKIGGYVEIEAIPTVFGLTWELVKQV